MFLSIQTYQTCILDVMPTARCERVPPTGATKWGAIDLTSLQEDDLPLGNCEFFHPLADWGAFLWVPPQLWDSLQHLFLVPNSSSFQTTKQSNCCFASVVGWIAVLTQPTSPDNAVQAAPAPLPKFYLFCGINNVQMNSQTRALGTAPRWRRGCPAAAACPKGSPWTGRRCASWTGTCSSPGCRTGDTTCTRSVPQIQILSVSLLWQQSLYAYRTSPWERSVTYAKAENLKTRWLRLHVRLSSY